MATKILSNEFMQNIATGEAWKELSGNFNWSETTLEKYQDKWDWERIIDSFGHDIYDKNAIEFYEKFKDYIPVFKLQNTCLWRAIVEQRS